MHISLSINPLYRRKGILTSVVLYCTYNCIHTLSAIRNNIRHIHITSSTKVHVPPLVVDSFTPKLGYCPKPTIFTTRVGALLKPQYCPCKERGTSFHSSFNSIIMPITRSGKSSSISALASKTPALGESATSSASSLIKSSRRSTRSRYFSSESTLGASRSNKDGEHSEEVVDNRVGTNDITAKVEVVESTTSHYDTEKSATTSTKRKRRKVKTTKIKKIPKSLPTPGTTINKPQSKTTSKEAATKKNLTPSTPSKAATKKISTASTPTSNKKSPKKTPPSSRKRKRIEPGSLAPPDKNWLSIYTLVQELRQDKTAPMDYDGGNALPQRHLGPKTYRYQVLTALMLSSQTKDAVVGDAMRTLQQYGLDVESINSIESNKLSDMIGKVGFYNNKTKFMKQTAKILIEEYDGDIPKDAEDMMKLPGVGPKMAYIIESIVYNRASGIGVDTHMHRIFNNLKWVNNTKTPEQTREQLEAWLPKDKWGELNSLFVGFGQESTQQKEKMLKKALGCSRPVDALYLLKKIGMDVQKESKKYGMEDEINVLLKGKKVKCGVQH